MYHTAKKAFTLIELLVVIAIIALLMAIVMPALHKAKEIAATSVCLSNQRQISMAYYIYAEDNDGRLTDAKPATSSDGWMTFSNTGVGNNYTTKCFIAEPMNDSGSFSNTSLEDKIRGFEQGGLWSYLEAHKVFNCPMDKRWRKPREDGSADQIGGYRSYSIGGVLSAEGYQLTATSTDESKVTIHKYSGFSNPSTKIIFLEEADGQGQNQNYWNMFLNVRKWYDPFAIWHNGSSTFGFADGHADRYKWTDEVMLDMASADSQGGEKNRLADVNSDDYDNIKRMYMPRRYKP